MEKVDRLIIQGLILTLDREDTVIEDGAVAISGTDIVAVGPSPEITKWYQADEVLNATGQIVMPGLINAHTHNGMTLYRGLVDDQPLAEWLDTLWEAENQFVNPDNVRLGAQLAYVEMIRGGTTMSVDMYWHPDASAQAAHEVGFRLMTGPAFVDFETAPDRLAVDERIGRGREFLETYCNDPLIVPCVAPHGTYTVSPENLQKTQALADEFGVFLSTHASETADEVATVTEQYGRSPLMHLEHLGMLSERTVLAHCVHLPDKEIEMLAARKTVVVHCPLSNLKLGSGVAKVMKMREAGVTVLLGTDGPASSNDLDLWMAMRFAAVLHRGVNHHPTFNTAQDVIRSVTSDAADALGVGAIVGSLEAGKRADIILIDLNRPHLVPMYNPFSHLVYTIGRDDVNTVLVNGRVVMRDREMLTIDEEALLGEVNVIAQYIARATSGA